MGFPQTSFSGVENPGTICLGWFESDFLVKVFREPRDLPCRTSADQRIRLEQSRLPTVQITPTVGPPPLSIYSGFVESRGNVSYVFDYTTCAHPGCPCR